MESRKVVDCRKHPSESHCSLTISGAEEEVVKAAAMHAAAVHGHPDTPESRERLRGMLEDESEPAFSMEMSEDRPPMPR